MAESSSNGSILTTWTENPGPTVAAIGLGVLLGLGVAYLADLFLQEKLAGDEPPIRVRNGSMYLELLGRGFEFEEHGPKDKKNWKIKGDPQRFRPEYTVIVITTSGVCPNGIVATTARVEFTYSDGQSIELVAPGQSTKIRANNSIDHPSANDKDQLQYGVSGYITAVKVGNPGSDLCTFSAEDPKLRVYLLD